jgi:hypothetical protein
MGSTPGEEDGHCGGRFQACSETRERGGTGACNERSLGDTLTDEHMELLLAGDCARVACIQGAILSGHRVGRAV